MFWLIRGKLHDLTISLFPMEESQARQVTAEEIEDGVDLVDCDSCSLVIRIVK